MTDDETRIAEIRQRAETARYGERAWTTLTKSLIHEDVPWLLDRLRATEAERDAEKDARDEVQEKIAYLRRNCMGLSEQELRQKIGAVDSAEWRRGYYWNTVVAEHRDKQVAAEVAQRAAEARAAEAEAVIAKARAVVARPLTWQESLSRDHSGKPFARMIDRYDVAAILSGASSAALARVKAEIWQEGMFAGAKWQLTAPTSDDPTRPSSEDDFPANPYRAGADQ